ncbi:hypothetical protein DFH06DRAFT_1145736 [Mycena polygramma]|nr:hypothetical protein DFH06DRAFT_1145736 [Mycena polygramma]
MPSTMKLGTDELEMAFLLANQDKDFHQSDIPRDMSFLWTMSPEQATLPLKEQVAYKARQIFAAQVRYTRPAWIEFLAYLQAELRGDAEQRKFATRILADVVIVLDSVFRGLSNAIGFGTVAAAVAVLQRVFRRKKGPKGRNERAAGGREPHRCGSSPHRTWGCSRACSWAKKLRDPTRTRASPAALVKFGHRVIFADFCGAGRCKADARGLGTLCFRQRGSRCRPFDASLNRADPTAEQPDCQKTDALGIQP